MYRMQLYKLPHPTETSEEREYPSKVDLLISVYLHDRILHRTVKPRKYEKCENTRKYKMCIYY